MPRGRREQRGSRFCFTFWCGGSQRDSGSSRDDDQRSAIEPTRAVKSPLREFASNTPAGVRVESSKEAGPAREDVDEEGQPRNPDLHLPLSLPKSAPSAGLSFHFYRAKPSVHGVDGQGPANAGIATTAQELPPHLSEHAHSSPPISGKKKTIAFAKVALQVAAAGLKAAPIPNLDQIPKILLSLIQTYEVSRLALSNLPRDTGPTYPVV